MKVNLNDRARVELSAHGIAWFSGYYHALKLKQPNLENGNVWKGQLWELFQIFGDAISIGRITPFNLNEIQIEKS